MRADRIRDVAAFLLPLFFLLAGGATAQDRLKLDYSSVDASNAAWYVAQEVGFFKKHGLDTELIYHCGRYCGRKCGRERGGECCGGRREPGHGRLYAQYLTL